MPPLSDPSASPFPIDLSRLPSPLPADRCAVAIDIGGTSVKILRVDGRGEGRFLSSVPTGERSPGEVISEVAAVIYGENTDRLPIDRCGVGFPGIVEGERKIIGSPNLQQWIGLDLAELFSERLKAPVRVGNDADLAALGESRFGGGAPVADLLFLTLGTGVGSGIVAGGKILTGARGFAGEGGHITVDPEGAPCGCGRRGCLEAHFSERAFAREARAAGFPEGFGARALFDLAKGGTPKATEIIEKGIDRLAIGISGMCALLDPEVVVLGGGISRAGDYLLRELEKALESRLRYPGYTRPPIRLSTLGADAGLCGALAL